MKASSYRDDMAREALVFELVLHQVDGTQELAAKHGPILGYRTFSDHASNMGLVADTAVDGCYPPLRYLFD